MDVTEINRRVGRSIGDTDNITYSLADLYDWVNSGMVQIITETECSYASTITAASTFPKVLPVDYIRTKRLVYNQTSLGAIAIDELDAHGMNLTEQYTPQFFYFLGNQINLFPLQQSNDVTLIRWDYLKMPVKVYALANIPEIPVVYHDDLVEYCKMRAHEANENLRSMEASKVLFESNMGLRTEIANRQDDTYEIIRDDPYENW